LIPVSGRTFCELALSETKGALPGPFLILDSCHGENLCELVSNKVREVLPVVSSLCGGLMDNWWVYIVEKKTGLYVGITTDLENRMRQHGQRVPLYYEGPISKTDALKRERILKGWSRRKKLELVAKASSQQK
jgi:predicted GIY-YIG superfamily endonuclease